MIPSQSTWSQLDEALQPLLPLATQKRPPVVRGLPTTTRSRNRQPSWASLKRVKGCMDHLSFLNGWLDETITMSGAG